MKKIIIAIIATLIIFVLVSPYFLNEYDMVIYDLTFWVALIFFILSFFGFKGKMGDSFAMFNRSRIDNYSHVRSNQSQLNDERQKNSNKFTEDIEIVFYFLSVAFIFLIATIVLYKLT